MYATRNDLPPHVRQGAVALLQKRLAEAIDLETQLKHAHWNVKGPHFIALHEFFDKVHGVAEEFVDTIAERITALGGTAHGTLAHAAQHSSLPAYPLAAVDGAAHLEAVANALAWFGKAVRKDIDAAAELGDAGTADLFTGIVRETDKQLWFVEAHLHRA